MAKLTAAQQRCLDKMEPKQEYCAYSLKESLATLRSLVKLGKVRDVTPFAAGGIFSPSTHFKFRKLG